MSFFNWARKLIIISGLWFFLHLLFIIVDGLTDDIQQADVAVILGNTVHPNGQVSDRLKSRLERGAALYKQGLIHSVLLSGGFGKEGFEEADVMAVYLIENHQIPDSVIYRDKNGYNSRMTAENTKLLADKHGWKTIIAVSQYYHISRLRLAFNQEGIETVYTAHAYFFEWRDLYSLLREFVGFYAYLIKCH